MHPLIDYSEGVDPTLIMLVSIPMFIFYRQIISGLKYLFVKIKILSFDKTEELEELMEQLDEGLGEFSNCLKGIDLKRWYAEEIY